MRELKVRAWDEIHKQMIYEFEGDFKIMTNEVDASIVCAGYNDNGDWKELEVMFFSGIIDSNVKEVFEGDLHKTEPIEVDGEMISSYLPVVFDNGAFWLDESFKKDGSLLTLLCEYDEPLNIQGNIHANPELLTAHSKTAN